MRVPLGIALVFAVSTATSAQISLIDVDRFPLTYSLGAGAPTPGALFFAEKDAGSAHVEWSSGELGIGPMVNVDAATDGTDVLPIPGLTCRNILTEFTVTKESQGAAGSHVRTETTGGDGSTAGGAASDIFGLLEVQTATTFESFYYHLNDALHVNANADLDAVLWGEEEAYPLYYSVSSTSALGLPGVSSGADILVQLASGNTPITTHLTFTQLGLVSGDDIDGLAIDEDGVVVYSLVSGSPSFSILGSPVDHPTTGSSYGGADLFRFDPASGLTTVYKESAELELLSGDDLNGIRITDPGPLKGITGSQACPPPNSKKPFEQLKMGGSTGNIQRVVHVPCGTNKTLSIDMMNDFEVATIGLFFTVGRPCNSQNAFIFPYGDLSFALTPVLLPPIVFNIPPGGSPQIPIPPQVCGITFTVQGLFNGQITGPNSTNAITIVVD